MHLTYLIPVNVPKTTPEHIASVNPTKAIIKSIPAFIVILRFFGTSLTIVSLNFARVRLQDNSSYKNRSKGNLPAHVQTENHVKCKKCIQAHSQGRGKWTVIP
jgi:hypothetical protein